MHYSDEQFSSFRQEGEMTHTDQKLVTDRDGGTITDIDTSN